MVAKKGRTESNRGMLNTAMAFIILASTIGVINSFLRLHMSIESGSQFIADWKNYMLLPLIWFLTYQNVRDKKGIKVLTFC